jgi:hypothetical protein
MVVDDTGRRDQENGWIVFMIFSRDQSCAPAMGELNEHRTWRIFIAKSSMFVPYSPTQCERNIYKNLEVKPSNQCNSFPHASQHFQDLLTNFRRSGYFPNCTMILGTYIYTSIIFYHYIIDNKTLGESPIWPRWFWESTPQRRLHGRFLPCARPTNVIGGIFTLW